MAAALLYRKIFTPISGNQMAADTHKMKWHVTKNQSNAWCLHNCIENGGKIAVKRDNEEDSFRQPLKDIASDLSPERNSWVKSMKLHDGIPSKCFLTEYQQELFLFRQF